MKLHANAALSPKGHQELCRRVVEGERRLSEAAEAAKVTPRMVEIVDRLGRRYIGPERPLSLRSINTHLFLLAQILDVAVDHGHLPSNPARGSRRRLKVSRPRPVHLDSAEHIAIVLAAAAQLDAGERAGRR